MAVLDDSDRIGEAKNPGPPRPQRGRQGSLFDVELVEQRAIVLRTRIWDAFVGWLRERLSDSAVLSLFSCASLLALVLRDYADELYKAGASLGSYRQLLAHSQKLPPLLRPHLKPAWEMVSRWEDLQPVCHRTPLPEIILKTLICLALALGWKRWAAVTICTFYAITRPGELLKMRRKHDLLQPKHPWMYFRVEKSKSRRKAAKTQHAKLSDRSALEFAVALWQDLPRSELLYPGSPGVYRRRWDSLLAMLRFLRAQSSLRAPFGLEEPSPCLFQKGLSVNDLLWRMRLKSLATLEFYLQEMSAISVLPDLPMATRRRIVTAASLFPRILQGGL